MKWDIILYETAVLFLIFTCVYCGIVLYKLTEIIKEKNFIWILPVISSVVLLLALLSHIYANFILMPQLNNSIEILTSKEGLMDEKLFESTKLVINKIKIILMQLKAFSFTSFFVAAFLITISSGIYINKISK
ncbi:MAG: hypothetical protein N3E50_10235 [Candidatus Goldbacteria bacterium]|nr:hypothetical protein [Candidatus Goldiibacteriota bacterium]